MAHNCMDKNCPYKCLESTAPIKKNLIEESKIKGKEESSTEPKNVTPFIGCRENCSCTQLVDLVQKLQKALADRENEGWKKPKVSEHFPSPTVIVGDMLTDSKNTKRHDRNERILIIETISNYTDIHGVIHRYAHCRNIKTGVKSRININNITPSKFIRIRSFCTKHYPDIGNLNINKT